MDSLSRPSPVPEVGIEGGRCWKPQPSPHMLGSPGHQHPSWQEPQPPVISSAYRRQLPLQRFQGFEELCARKLAGRASSSMGKWPGYWSRDHLTGSQVHLLSPSLSWVSLCSFFPLEFPFLLRVPEGSPQFQWVLQERTPQAAKEAWAYLTWKLDFFSFFPFYLSSN